MKRKLFFAAVFWYLAAGTAWPIDSIYTSTSDKTLMGEITGMSPTVINFKPFKDGPSEIAVNEIKRIRFEFAAQPH